MPTEAATQDAGAFWAEGTEILDGTGAPIVLCGLAAGTYVLRLTLTGSRARRVATRPVAALH